MKSRRPSVAYPFITAREVRTRCESGAVQFIKEAVEILHRRYVDRDILESPSGWMASHRKLGEELHARLASDECTDDDVSRAGALAKRYAKQLAKVLRDDQIARDPRLGFAAAVYGVRPADAVYYAEDPFAEEPDEDETARTADSDVEFTASIAPLAADAEAERDVTTPEAPDEAPSPRRRPGRPKGSKNKHPKGSKAKSRRG